ncbi:adhesion G protein-coupled receptor E3-like [Engraulis encrasicolus]|uniref:adhesion G protein-coupled receptor E3-like n=1 Tax=Engraulis encrasicolus TaxID=184585 RepID=UPI002FD1BE47
MFMATDLSSDKLCNIIIISMIHINISSSSSSSDNSVLSSGHRWAGVVCVRVTFKVGWLHTCKWISIVQECKSSGSNCVLEKMLAQEKRMNESTLLNVELLLPPVDLLAHAASASRADDFLGLIERLVSRLNFSSLASDNELLPSNNVELAALIYRENSSHNGSSELGNKAVTLEIDLQGIAQNNNGSASVVMVTAKNLHNVLNSSFFRPKDGELAVMNAEVTIIVLPQIVNGNLSKPINITFQHLNVSGEGDASVCVFWSEGAWITDGCVASQGNSSHSVCTCDHLSTFALIMQTQPPTTEGDPVVERLSTVFMVVGLVFLSLAVLTFALCRFNPRVSNMARLNLSLCLLLAHTLFLITQAVQPQKMACKVLAGLLHFLFLSAFVWMSAEAVLLFMSVRKLRQIKAKDRAGLHWTHSLLLGYGVPLAIVAVSAAVVRDGHGSQKCWLKTDKGFNWSFLGPACFMLTGNIILFVIIFITIHTTLKEARSEASKIKYTRLLLFKIMSQCVILGCPWMLLMIQVSPVLEFLAASLVSQQGTAIFLIHCLLNPEVRKQYATWWQKRVHSSRKSSGSSSMALSTASQQGSSEAKTRHTTLNTAQEQTQEVAPQAAKKDSCRLVSIRQSQTSNA